jgi:hypothetical protein
MLCLFYYAYVFSLTKLKIRAEQFLSESNGEEGEVGGGGDRLEEGGEMTQIMYAHVNRSIKKKESIFKSLNISHHSTVHTMHAGPFPTEKMCGSLTEYLSGNRRDFNYGTPKLNCFAPLGMDQEQQKSQFSVDVIPHQNHAEINL